MAWHGDFNLRATRHGTEIAENLCVYANVHNNVLRSICDLFPFHNHPIFYHQLQILQFFMATAS